jgi:hypothetical protein
MSRTLEPVALGRPGPEDPRQGVRRRHSCADARGRKRLPELVAGSLGVLLEDGSAGADRVSEAWVCGPGPAASHDVEHPAEIGRPARDQEGVGEGREGVGAVCRLHDAQRRQRVQQDAGAALVGCHARCERGDLVLAFGEPVENAKLHRCLQDRRHLQPLHHLHQGLWRDRRSLHRGLCLGLHHVPLSFVSGPSVSRRS